jgi:PAS domain S-box-containing protein
MKPDPDVLRESAAALRKQVRKMKGECAAQAQRIEDLEKTLHYLQQTVRIYADEYDFSPIGSVTLTDRGYIQAINITGVRMLFAKGRSSLIHKPFLPYVAKDDFKKFLDHMRRCRSTAERVVTELRLSTKGISTQVQLVSVPVLDVEREAVVHRTAMIDVTDRLIAQKALEENEKRYRDLVDLSPDAIWVHSAGRIVLVNPAAVKLFGAESPEDILDKNILDFIHPDYKATMFFDNLPEFRDETSGPPHREERRMIFQKSLVDLEISAASLTFRDREAVMVIARDISPRKQLEQEILNISEREQSRVGQDLHDGLCQELAGVAFLAEALKHNLAAEKLPSAAASADAGAIANLIKGAIDVAHGMATGLYPVSIEENGLMSALEELATDTARRFQIKCRFKCGEPIALPDNKAATHVYRIAQEAVNNAIKHGAANSVFIKLDETGGKIILKIEDNGAGELKNMKRPGMGLKTMNYRAQTIGGLLEIQHRRRGGIAVICSFPKPQKQ